MNKLHFDSENWINSKPLSSADLLGKVVLVDFWTFSCINCLRTIPHLKSLWEKYTKKGLIIVGVHSPEFDFEKDLSRVKRFIEEQKIGWPIVLDNDKKIWNTFGANYWPSKYLFNKDGEMVYEHFGEGAYGQTEKKIEELLGLAGDKADTDEHAHGAVCFRPTPEIYLGYGRGTIAAVGDVLDKESDYQPPKELKENSVGLKGKFVMRKEYIETKVANTQIFLNFHATQVNAVLSPVDTKAQLNVKIDSNPIVAEERGSDLNSEGSLQVETSRMYNLYQGKEKKGVLSLELVEGAYRAYTFTFSGCEDYQG